MCRLGMVGAIELTSQMEAFFNITQRNIATIMERITKFQLEGKVLTTMDLMEKKLTEERLRDVRKALSAQYRTVVLDDKEFFVATDGAFFRVYAFPGQAALVIEYADTEQEARQNALEDGDRFYLDEMDLDTMLQNMVKEIERC
nr:MAG TPA: hypothetical protein [Caudoviricetes sp.]